MKVPAKRLTALGAVAAVAGGAIAVAIGSGAMAPVKDYASSLVPEYETAKLLSAGDTVPETSNPSKQYQMVGIPDGLGAERGKGGTVTLYMNHELTGTALSAPVLGGPLNRGALVSKLLIDGNGKVLSGERAYDTVYIDDTLVGPAAEVGNATRPFSRFCSGSLAGKQEGFDRPIYFANEEEGTAANTFDGSGGLAVAIFDNQAHALTDLGHFAWENTLVQSGSGNRTVIMGMEDGPADLDLAKENSQLYMYVGTKTPKKGATVLERNGLVGGTLYVFRAKDRRVVGEAQFTEGSLEGEWVAIPGADEMDEDQLEAASDKAGAMVFARPEDGAWSTRNDDAYFFVTTGGAAGANELGRIYSLAVNRKDPTQAATLTVVSNADKTIAGGGDTAISPDNIDVSGSYLMVQEDGTTESRLVMAAKGRDGSIWRFELSGKKAPGVDPSSAKRVVTLSPPGRDGVAVKPGVWETSGIIDADGILGADSWLFDVQAHAPTAAPAPDTVEDGQLLVLRRTKR